MHAGGAGNCAEERVVLCRPCCCAVGYGDVVVKSSIGEDLTSGVIFNQPTCVERSPGVLEIA